MPEKKVVKTDFEKKMWEARDSVVETAWKVWEESKKVAWKVWTRWKKSTNEEKICMCLWVLLILIWLFAFDSVRKLIIPLIMVILWVLLVTGFFNKSSKK